MPQDQLTMNQPGRNVTSPEMQGVFGLRQSPSGAQTSHGPSQSSSTAAGHMNLKTSSTQSLRTSGCCDPAPPSRHHQSHNFKHASGHDTIPFSKEEIRSYLFVSKNNITVTLHVGDIVEAKVEALVTSEDIDLQHESMVTQALCNLANGGKNFECERAKQRRLYGIAKEWQVTYTYMINKHSNFPFKYVFHIILPPYHGAYDDEWMNKLALAYAEVFRQAERHNLKTIAVPFLGTGGYGADLSDAIQIAVHAVAEHTPKNLSHVQFVSLEEEPIKYAQIFCESLLMSDDEARKQSQGRTDGSQSPSTGPSYSTDHAVTLQDKGDQNQDQASGHDHSGRPKPRKGHFNRNGSTFCGNVSKSGTKRSDAEPVIHKASVKAELKTEEKLKDKSEDFCPICMDKMTDQKVLSKCKHVFCRECIETYFEKYKPVCPSCQTTYGEVTGNMPKGKMEIQTDEHPSVPGYEKYGLIIIDYSFLDGIQTAEHPNPGHSYRGTTRTAYLPNSHEGRKVLSLLKVAWERRLTFTVGRSTTTGRDNVVTWNDIHHKTNLTGGESQFGYPDKTYLSRVTEELASKGVTEPDADYFQ